METTSFCPWHIMKNHREDQPADDHEFPPRTWQVSGLPHDPNVTPIIMGILNVTPDSFSDGGQFTCLDDYIQRAMSMIEQGASIIDIGGESTRPGSHPVPVDEEIQRVVPVIQAIRSASAIPLSIDTRKVEVAREALDAGAVIVNDVEANRQDDAMWKLVANAEASYVAMHMQGEPKSMQSQPVYENVVAEVLSFLDDRLKRISTAGIPHSRVLVDVGIGFGKSLNHNLELLRHIREFNQLGCHQLMGVSRKSLFGKLLGLEVHERLVPSVAACLWGLNNGVRVFRVHDVRETADAFRLWAALQSH